MDSLLLGMRRPSTLLERQRVRQVYLTGHVEPCGCDLRFIGGRHEYYTTPSVRQRFHQTLPTGLSELRNCASYVN